MCRFLPTLVLIAWTSAATAQATDLFLGRPPSVGVVRGGGFGASGTDYFGETRADGSPAARRLARAPASVARHRRSGSPRPAGSAKPMRAVHP